MMNFKRLQKEIRVGDFVIMDRELGNRFQQGIPYEFMGYEKCDYQKNDGYHGADECITCKGKMIFNNAYPHCMCYGSEESPITITHRRIELPKELFTL